MSDYRIRVLGGLPAIARVTSFYPYVPATWDSPSEGGEVEFEILDQRGRPAAWLERRLTDKDFTQGAWTTTATVPTFTEDLT